MMMVLKPKIDVYTPKWLRETDQASKNCIVFRFPILTDHLDGHSLLDLGEKSIDGWHRSQNASLWFYWQQALISSGIVSNMWLLGVLISCYVADT